jgi:hypothetical protein
LEFAYHILHKRPNLVILSMVWLAYEDGSSHSRNPRDPDTEALIHWLGRLEPVIRAEELGEIIVVLANRCGTENGVVYTGTSAVLGIEGGEVNLYGFLGCGEEELLVVDTSRRPQARLVVSPARSAYPCFDSRMWRLDIVPKAGIRLDTEKDESPPTSASSMTTNTPWEKSPGVFRAEDIVDVLKHTILTSPDGSNFSPYKQEPAAHLL